VSVSGCTEWIAGFECFQRLVPVRAGFRVRRTLTKNVLHALHTPDSTITLIYTPRQTDLRPIPIHSDIGSQYYGETNPLITNQPRGIKTSYLTHLLSNISFKNIFYHPWINSKKHLIFIWRRRFFFSDSHDTAQLSSPPRINISGSAWFKRRCSLIDFLDVTLVLAPGMVVEVRLLANL